MPKKLLVLKKSFIPSFYQNPRDASHFAQLMQALSPAQESNPISGSLSEAKMAIPKLFGPKLGSRDAVHMADMAMYALVALTNLRLRTIVVNGINEHGRVASASTARRGTFAAGQRPFEAPRGFLDRHGLISRDYRGALHLFPHRVIWRSGADGWPELDRLERDVFNPETQNSEKTLILQEDHDKLPIIPEAKAALLDYMRNYSPIDFGEFEQKLNNGEYNGAELNRLIMQATSNHNKEIKSNLYDTIEGEFALNKHFDLPHFYFYDQDRSDPIPSIFDPQKSKRVFYDADKKILVKNNMRDYGVYRAVSLDDLKNPFKSLLTYFRPHPLVSHHFANNFGHYLFESDKFPQASGLSDSTPRLFKSSVAHSYSPYSYSPYSLRSIKQEWQEAIRQIPDAASTWNQETAMRLARDLFVRSRRRYSEGVLNSSFKKLAGLLNYGDNSEFAPYDRYIMPSSTKAQVPEGRRPLNILAIASDIMNKKMSSSPWQGIFQFSPFPSRDSAGNLTWLVNPAEMNTDEIDGIAYPVQPSKYQSSFMNQRAATGAIDLSMKSGLAKVRGWPYQWRSTNEKIDLSDGDEHALILDMLRALHESGKDWTNGDAIFDLIHKHLVSLRSASGFSSHHRLVNDIHRLFELNFYAGIGNEDAIKKLIAADKPKAPNGEGFFDYFTKEALQKRARYLDSLAAWQQQNQDLGPFEKKPLPQVENTLYHELSTLVSEDSDVEKIGQRIDAQSKDHEKYISSILSTSGQPVGKKSSEKSVFFRTYIYPFIQKVMEIHGIKRNEQYIPGTSIKIPEHYEDPSWGADDKERKYHQDVIFHFAHHLMKIIVGNETCHWCDGHGIVRMSEFNNPIHCSYCNVGKSPEDERFRQILAPEVGASSESGTDSYRRVPPAWDITQMGTYANNSAASQFTPRLFDNFHKLFNIHPTDIISIIRHSVVKNIINDFINNPKKYVPKAIVSDEQEKELPGDVDQIHTDGSGAAGAADGSGAAPAGSADAGSADAGPARRYNRRVVLATTPVDGHATSGPPVSPAPHVEEPRKFDHYVD